MQHDMQDGAVGWHSGVRRRVEVAEMEAVPDTLVDEDNKAGLLAAQDDSLVVLLRETWWPSLLARLILWKDRMVQYTRQLAKKHQSSSLVNPSPEPTSITGFPSLRGRSSLSQSSLSLRDHWLNRRKRRRRRTTSPPRPHR